jgi:hypothetical protein
MPYFVGRIQIIPSISRSRVHRGKRINYAGLRRQLHSDFNRADHSMAARIPAHEQDGSFRAKLLNRVFRSGAPL